MSDSPQKDNSSESPAIQDIYLKLFQENNPHCKYLVEDDLFFLQNPWGDSDCRLAYELTEADSLNTLNKLAFNSQLDAIIHIDTNEIEFIFAYLVPDKEPEQSYLNRSFTLHLDGQELSCRFAEPSDRLMEIARRVRRIPSDSGMRVVPQLEAFTDAQLLDQLPEIATRFFLKRVPRNFFIKSTNPVLSLNLEHIARHVNFVMRYYDRKTPLIDIRTKASSDFHEYIPPQRFCAGSFPESFIMQGIDEFILQLIEVAHLTSPRFAFIYYFQVIEYAGFYFINEKAKRALKSFLRDPMMINCPENKMHDLFSILSDLAHNDDGKMRKVIEECCDPNEIWSEIENDKDFFCNDINFDGGFILPPLIASDTTRTTWSTMWMPKVHDHLTKIRNCLVHGREKRQSNVILPTSANNSRIARYIPLIARIAEQIALKKD